MCTALSSASSCAPTGQTCGGLRSGDRRRVLESRRLHLRDGNPVPGRPTMPERHVCVCDAVSCGKGCCVGNTCQPGNTPSVCGSGGNSCASCPSGEKCAGGACSGCSAACPGAAVRARRATRGRRPRARIGGGKRAWRAIRPNPTDARPRGSAAAEPALRARRGRPAAADSASATPRPCPLRLLFGVEVHDTVALGVRLGRRPVRRVRLHSRRLFCTSRGMHLAAGARSARKAKLA